VSISNLQNVFNKILAEEVVFLSFTTKKDYDSCRVNLLRKFKNHKKLYESLGADNPYQDRFIQCSFDKEFVRGKFQLAEEADRRNVPNAVRFQVEEL